MGGQTATQTSQDQNTGRSEDRSQALARHIAGSGPHADMLDLQHAAGNQAVSELVQSSHTASRGHDVPPIVRSVLNSNGQPLDPATRAYMEPRFGHDFSGVRVHTDAKAAESARAVDARAFTVGRHMVFAPGKYAPNTPDGKRLLAHELSHMLQQRNAPAVVSGSLRVTTPNDPHEVEADHITRGVSRDAAPERSAPGECGAPMNVTSTGAEIARQMEGPSPGREALVEGGQVLPRVQVGRDDKNPSRLLLRYGDDVVATLEVRGKAADVDGIQVRDRTGARKQGQRIDTIDVDVVHPPGVTITLEISRPSLAKTRKRFGILDVKVKPVEAKPPYRKDELQLWPPAHDLGTIRQRRPMNARERAEEERWRDEERARELKESRQTAAHWKTYHTLEGILDHSEQSLEDLRDVGIAFQLLAPPLPPPTIWNDANKELSLAAKARDQRFPGWARVHLGRADAALQAANAKVWAAMQRGLENIKTAERITTKVGLVSSFVGETVAKLIPGPVGKFLSFLYLVGKPLPKTDVDVEDALRRGGTSRLRLPPWKDWQTGSGTPSISVWGPDRVGCRRRRQRARIQAPSPIHPQRRQRPPAPAPVRLRRPRVARSPRSGSTLPKRGRTSQQDQPAARPRRQMSHPRRV